jgi:hypothetical protein
MIFGVISFQLCTQPLNHGRESSKLDRLGMAKRIVWGFPTPHFLETRKERIVYYQY